MWILGPIGFLNPWVLLGGGALPVLWVLLRAVPPAPVRQRFPGVALLLGLKDEASETDRTPWWLLLLRLFAIGAVIAAFSEPVLNPSVAQKDAPSSDRPLLVLLDGTWADAPTWSSRLRQVQNALDEAEQAGRLAAVMLSTSPENLAFQSASELTDQLSATTPKPFFPDARRVIQALAESEAAFDTLWISSGLDYQGHDDVLAALLERGAVSVLQAAQDIAALRPAEISQTGVSAQIRVLAAAPKSLTVLARGPDPSGIPRILGEAHVSAEQFTRTRARSGTALQSAQGLSVHEWHADVDIALEAELRNRVTRIEIAGVRSAGAVQLAGNALRRPEVALIAGGNTAQGPLLLSSLHYLRAAFEPFADVIEGDFLDLILANPDIIVLADVARVSEAEEAALLEWTSKGGQLLRFSGPRLAASDVAREGDDPLMPVRLRAGGRTVGGAMSWGEPKPLRAFPETSPFYGLSIPEDVAIHSQIMAQPDPSLSARVLATLDDGTPLVTRKPVGQGQVVLFHVTANAEWSNLPLSGLFVSMLQRLSGAVLHQQEAFEAQTEEALRAPMVPLMRLDGFGVLSAAGPVANVTAQQVFAGSNPVAPAGLYQGASSIVASNAFGASDSLTAVNWPSSVQIVAAAQSAQKPLLPHLLVAAFAALMVDVLASLGVMGRLTLVRILVLTVALTAFQASSARAQDAAELLQEDTLVLAAVSDVTFAHVLTGDAARDEVVHQGLVGLAQVMFERTSVEPAAPIGIDLQTAPLDVFPLIYWSVSADQPLPSPESYAKLNAYMRSGGMILFDTADADIAFGNSVTRNGEKLQEIARNLDIPPLEPVPEGHVLTRSFYLLDEISGRYTGGALWLEVTPDRSGTEQFTQRLNDNVSPVVIGGMDWASAWAIDDLGRPLRPVGQGYNGEQQRENARRFGVNLVMYVLTGNYKSDQVHVPDLLERLGKK